jgi:hydroxymethylglutaryl-CoA lyase
VIPDIRIVEVGPRDGLQNEKVPIPTAAKLEFVRHLSAAGLTEIEATSFVSPKWVPQLADAAELWPQLEGIPSKFSALIPNRRGLESALGVGVDRIALFTAASESFTKHNINMTIDESLNAFADVVQTFRERVPDGWVRAYVSTAIACPYDGPIDIASVTRVTEKLIELGVDEISFGDTIGVAVPKDVDRLTPELLQLVPIDKLAWHFHDTRGTAIANVAAALKHGVRIFDSSAAGLGGCPYAPGAGGNLATEDLVYFLAASGLSTGVDSRALAMASLPILDLLGRAPSAKSQIAALASA